MDTHSPCDLKGLSVLVTRPAAQAEGLCTAIEIAGGRPVRFPTVKITGSAGPTAIERLKDASRFDWVIFVSTNAVRFGTPLLEIDGQSSVAAVGRSTANALRELGFTDVLTPQRSADSEALLALTPLQRVRGQRILIVRGDGGRPLLGDTLQQRGANVAYAEVYRRELPSYDNDELTSAAVQNADAVTATSAEILQNLVALLGPGTALLERPLVVVSPRVAAVAQHLGFTHITTARGARSDVIISALCDLVNSG